jgi:hypothetical protein
MPICRCLSVFKNVGLLTAAIPALSSCKDHSALKLVLDECFPRKVTLDEQQCAKLRSAHVDDLQR